MKSDCGPLKKIQVTVMTLIVKTSNINTKLVLLNRNLLVPIKKQYSNTTPKRKKKKAFAILVL
jgi:hypothetical protein